jgi:hypothetical protein
MEKLYMEKEPIRPPSESQSLLIRTTRNCPWNRCAFCHTYLGQKFKLRTVGEISDDIGKAGAIAGQLCDISRQEGSDGCVTPSALNRLCERGEFAEESIRSVAAWLYHGGESVFLQDADSLIMKTDNLVRVISLIREAFPSVRRITSYCRSKTAASKPLEDLKRVHDAGLTRIHVGLESGCDAVLRFMNKGVTAAEQVEGGLKLKEAGISLCTYVMPGLGGKRWSAGHAVETAGVINLINPDFVRLRTLHVVKGSSLYGMMEKGEFEPLGEEDIVREIRIFIDHLNGIETMIVSDHILNLLEEITGKLPEDKTQLQTIIDRFFSLPAEERLIFRVGRTKGIYRRIDDLADKETHLWLKGIVDQYMQSDSDRLEQDLRTIRHSII